MYYYVQYALLNVFPSPIVTSLQGFRICIPNFYVFKKIFAERLLFIVLLKSNLNGS